MIHTEPLAKHALILVIAITGTLIIVAGCTTTAPAQSSTIQSVPAVNVTIKPDITAYSIAMSSAPGIGLTPNITGLPAGGGAYEYTWKTDYGLFLTWNAPDYVVREQGSTVTLPGGKVYWTYTGAPAGTIRPPVHVTLDVIDTKAGSTVGHAEQVIGWSEGNIAVIR